MKKIRIKINDLIDQHGTTFGNCPGCSLCTDIQSLRDKLLQEPADRFAHILQKGQGMTKSEIAFLIENEVNRKTIMKSLKMGQYEFLEMMNNFGMLKKRSQPIGVKEMAKISLEEYQDLKAKGLPDKDIAESKEMHPTYLSQMKKQWGISVTKERAPKVAAQATSASKDVLKLDKQSEYESLIADLKAKVSGQEIHIDKLEQVIEKYNSKEADYEAALAQKVDRIMELEGSLVEVQNQIDYLNAACDDVENEADLIELENLRIKAARLEAEINPIRQLAFLKLKQDVGQ